MTKAPYKRRPDIPGHSAREEQLLAMIAALAAELSIVRDRLDTVERLAHAAGVFASDAVERYVPDGEATNARDAARRRMIDRTFRAVRDAAARDAPPSGEPE